MAARFPRVRIGAIRANLVTQYDYRPIAPYFSVRTFPAQVETPIGQALRGETRLLAAAHLLPRGAEPIAADAPDARILGEGAEVARVWAVPSVL